MTITFAGTINEALRDRKHAISEKRCVMSPIGCGRQVKEEDFRDSVSLAEYGISALCQDCQDSVFSELERQADGEPDPTWDESLSL